LTMHEKIDRRSLNERDAREIKPAVSEFLNPPIIEATQTRRKNRIAIIGGGPAAVATLFQLVSELKKHSSTCDTEIMVFEKGGAIGKGLPYSQQKNHYILNLPKQAMDVSIERMGVFASWLKTVEGCPQETDFPPRHYFGQYLQAVATQLQAEAQTVGILIKYYTHSEVINIEQNGAEEYVVHTTQQKFNSQYVILCTGHLPSSTYRQFIGTPGYRHNPWEEAGYVDIPPGADVGILGNRLTAIDVCLNLFSRGHQGTVWMLSNNGLLPSVLSPTVPSYPLRYLTLSNFNYFTNSGLTTLPLETLLDLFWKEISEAEGRKLTFESIVTSDRDLAPLEWINQQISWAEAGPKPWQQVLFEIYKIVPFIWPLLSFRDRKIFLAKYHSTFMAYLAAFPLENAYKIRDHLASGQLQIRGGLQTVMHTDGRFHLILNDGKVFSTAHLFNATSPGHDASLVPLYARLFKAKLIQKHHLGGVQVNTKTFQVISSQRRHNLYAVGALTHGTCLMTSDFGAVARHGSQAALKISQLIQARSLADRLRPPVNHSLSDNMGSFFHRYVGRRARAIGAAVSVFTLGASCLPSKS